jgi:acyl carrier protein
MNLFSYFSSESRRQRQEIREQNQLKQDQLNQVFHRKTQARVTLLTAEILSKNKNISIVPLRKDIVSRVVYILIEQLEIHDTTENNLLLVNMDSSIKVNLGGDSLDGVELGMAFEDEYNIEIPDDAMEKVKTI